MSKRKSKPKKSVCKECGVDARENTLFCYNCGHRLADAKLPESSVPAESPSVDALEEARESEDETPATNVDAAVAVDTEKDQDSDEKQEPIEDLVLPGTVDGDPVADDEQEDSKKAALDDLAAKFKIDDPPSEDKLAQAAEERRKARAVRRKPKQYVWEPGDDSSNRLVLLLAILIFVLATGIVFLTVYWK